MKGHKACQSQAQQALEALSSGLCHSHWPVHPSTVTGKLPALKDTEPALSGEGIVSSYAEGPAKPLLCWKSH